MCSPKLIRRSCNNSQQDQASRRPARYGALVPVGRMPIAGHPTCSMNHLGISSQLSKIASSLAVEAEVPIGNTCCGTAGDRGLLHPELVVSGTRDTKAVLDAKPADAYISANRTCEMGLLHATGRALCIAAAALAWPSRQFQWRSRDGGSGRPPTFDQFQFAG
jgi:hypothetical protein